MKQAYKSFQFKPDTLKLIVRMNGIIENYVRQGYTLSVRQIYYQLVAAALIPNTEASYKRVASIINDGRLAGLIDWDHIEDRNRNVIERNHWGSGASLLRACADQFYMPHWENQDERVMVIVEKAALEGVLGGVCREYDVPLLSARGYPSVSIMREMALKHIRPAIAAGQHVTLLHLGDHDPSGIDMTRDLEDRLGLFLQNDASHMTLKRIALTRDQIDEVNPPPNPAKTTDSRFNTYRDLHGDESWELDALEPNYIVNLVTEEIDACRDEDLWAQKDDEIESVKTRLRATAREF